MDTLKNFIVNFLFLSLPTISLTGTESNDQNFVNFPQNIDFGKYSTIWGSPFNKESWILGHDAFNFAPELTQFFELLKRDYHVDTVVETGTYRGATTVVFALHFDKVHTIEVVNDVYSKAQENLKKFDNVQCHLGSSEKVLGQLLPTLKGKRTLFYLDAHWESYWPLLEELEEISKTHRDNCIIVIDDFKVPNREDLPYDKYDAHECSFEYIKEKLDHVYTAYDYHYLIPKSRLSRAKFIAIPKDFKVSSQQSNQSPQ